MKTRSFLRERNFMILLSGVFINGIGAGVYAVSGMLLVLYLSGNVFYSGLAYFAVTLANALAFLIAPFARYVTYKKGLIVCEVLKSALLFTLPLFYATIGLNVYYVITLLFAVSLLAKFTYPIESTIMPIIVGKENIIKANAYLQTVREGMGIAFVAGAGVLVAFIGPVQAILITAVCHLLSSLTYTLFRFRQNTVPQDRQGMKQSVVAYKTDLKAGMTYISQSLIPKMIGSIIFINMALGVMVPNLPAFTLMKGNSEAIYGFYLAGLSLGVMIGTLVTPKVKECRFGLLTVIGFSSTGIAWLGTAFLPVYFSLPCFCIGSIAIGIFNILIFSSIQQQVEEAMIGRVVTVLSSAAAVGVPVGSLIGGALGSTFTPVLPVAFCGIAMLLFSASWLVHPVLRKLPAIEKASLFVQKPVQSQSV
ncbi:MULTISPECIES: MFS transporter [Shouchella]|uniref:MFS transporter n=1 Tax=Shouchella TaxID=2893057 RepID=UPI000BA76E6C|nr:MULTISPECIES: MFS transporter [Shouchella]MBX0319238.1 MFS transporter [Shouchella clausii]MCM3378436.1 MFS transporter [Shouchella rhizosphaerae]PAE83313.1 MFS transporter [Shouchella clausii]